MNKKRLIPAAILFVAGIILNLYLAPAVHLVISKQWEGFHQLSIANGISLIASDKKAAALFMALMGMTLILVLMLLLSRKSRVYESEMMDIMDTIRTPAPAGQFQHGSARWLPKADFAKVFAAHTLESDRLEALLERAPPEAGIVLGLSKRHKLIHSLTGKLTPRKLLGELEKPKSERVKFSYRETETIYFNKGDTHTVCLGATRSGKSRTVVLQSIGLMGLAGESIVISDMKGVRPDRV